jgi:hypothetical protein
MACIEVYVIDDVNVYGILNLCTATTSSFYVSGGGAKTYGYSVRLVKD